MNAPGSHTKSRGGTLREQGFRYIQRGSNFQWRHPTDSKPGDIDCTDMDEDTFFRQVMQSGAGSLSDDEVNHG